MVAVGMLVALQTMVRSFRHTVDSWITQTLRGDLYVEPVGHRQAGRGTSLPAAFVERLRARPGVAAIDTYRATPITYHGALAWAVGIEFAVQRDHGHLSFTRGEDSRVVLDRARADGGAIVTESFAHRHRVRAGDRIELPGGSGAVSVPVEGVFYDYSVDAGAVLLDRATYARLWGDDRTESLAIYLAPGADVTRVRADVIALAGPDELLFVTPNAALRRRVLLVFDQTFQITWALQAVAIVVAILGVVTTLTTLVLQRAREIAVLRAVGASRTQVAAMVVTESGVLGLAGALLGAFAGLVLALLLVDVINRQSFGWSLQLQLEPGVFAGAIALIVITALVAGLLPARLAAQAGTADALRRE